MTSKRDLGLPLAIAGGVIAVGAVIAGFLVIGGPGDARDKRLDGIIMGQIDTLAALARCAYEVKGEAPASIDEMRDTAAKTWPTRVDITDCSHRFPVDGDAIKADYERIDSSHVRLCGTFRRAAPQRETSRLYVFFPALKEARPAGRHCYDLELDS